MSRRDEQIKLRANYLNGLAIAFFAVGGIAPVLSPIVHDAWTVPVAVVCAVISLALHLWATMELRELPP
jgi:hypothetical protein